MKVSLNNTVSIIAKIVFFVSLLVILFCLLMHIFMESTNFEFADDGDSFTLFVIFAVPTSIFLTLFGMFIKQPIRLGDWGALRIVGTLILSFLVFIGLLFSIGFDMCVTSYSAPIYQLKADPSVTIVFSDFGCGATDSTPSSKAIVKVEKYPLGLIYVTYQIDTSLLDKSKWMLIEEVNQNKYNSLEDTLHLPFDTNRVIQMLNIPYEKSAQNMALGLDTMVLKYAGYACECPQWIDTKYSDSDILDDEAKNFSYYMEAVKPDLEIDERIFKNGNEIRIIGKLKTKSGLPKDTGHYSPDPPKGKVFVYSSYEVLFPLKVWGPKYHTGTTQIPKEAEELIHNCSLTIKKQPND